MRPRILLSWLPLTMLLVFAIASRTICTPKTSTVSDAPSVELRALARSFYLLSLPEVESQLGVPASTLGSTGQDTLTRNWRCYRKDQRDIHLYVDSSGIVKSVLICHQKPDKSLLASWPPTEELHRKRRLRLQLARH